MTKTMKKGSNEINTLRTYLIMPEQTSYIQRHPEVREVQVQDTTFGVSGSSSLIHTIWGRGVLWKSRTLGGTHKEGKCTDATHPLW